MGYYNSLQVDKQQLFLSERSIWVDSQNEYLLEVHDKNPYNDSCITITRLSTGEKIAAEFGIPGEITFIDYDSKNYDDHELDRSYVILYADWTYGVKENSFSIYITNVENGKYSYLENATLIFRKCTTD